MRLLTAIPFLSTGLHSWKHTYKSIYISNILNNNDIIFRVIMSNCAKYELIRDMNRLPCFRDETFVFLRVYLQKQVCWIY